MTSSLFLCPPEPPGRVYVDEDASLALSYYLIDGKENISELPPHVANIALDAGYALVSIFM